MRSFASMRKGGRSWSGRVRSIKVRTHCVSLRARRLVQRAQRENRGQEAQIIKMRGPRGAVTIATNVAGRGADIKLGETVPSLGGLHIIGTERHESRRIDDRLRGRAGRQGDPGSTRFFISLQDEVMRLFGGDRLTTWMDRFGFSDETPIEAGLVSKSIERAQSKVENHNYEIRKQVLEYDDVMNKQREVIYAERRRVLQGENLRDFMLGTLSDKIVAAVNANAPENVHPSEWDRGDPDRA